MDFNLELSRRGEAANERVRSFLRRRYKVSSGGYTIFSDTVVFGKLGVLRLRDVHLGRLP